MDEAHLVAALDWGGLFGSGVKIESYNP